MANKFRKKPTIKEMANVIIEINKKVNENAVINRELDSVLGLYITWKGDMPEFTKYLNEKIEERRNKNYKEANGEADITDIQEHPKDERSGTEGVREKTE